MRWARRTSGSGARSASDDDSVVAVMESSIEEFHCPARPPCLLSGRRTTAAAGSVPTLPTMHSDDLAAVMARARSHSLADIPRRSARKQPDKTAIIDGDVVLSFAEFDHLVDRAAAALHENGLLPGDRVALLSRNCW